MFLKTLWVISMLTLSREKLWAKMRFRSHIFPLIISMIYLWILLPSLFFKKIQTLLQAISRSFSHASSYFIYSVQNDLPKTNFQVDYIGSKIDCHKGILRCLQWKCISSDYLIYPSFSAWNFLKIQFNRVWKNERKNADKFCLVQLKSWPKI